MLSLDEKSQIQALDRTVPILPMQPGKVERPLPRLPPRHHHPVRRPGDRHRQSHCGAQAQAPPPGVPGLLKHIERTYRDAVDEHGQPLELHLVMDNYAAHKHKNVRDWLEVNPRFKVHLTPTHASWMNLVEVWFGLVERQAVRRGVFKSVPDLNAKLRAYIEG